ncbi:MAG: SurA N-terminal domain-containing protein [Nitrospirota bacterium]
MLKALRTHAKYFYVLFFIVILSFIFWGVGPLDENGGVQVVAEVGKYKITADDYWKTYDRAYRFYRDVYREKFDEEMEKEMNLKEKVLNTMINERILLAAAKDMGVTVTDEELQESIAREPFFLKNGVFDKEVYLNRLKLNRVTPELYENLKRQELTIDKIRNLIELTVDVSDVDVGVPKTSGNEQVVGMLSQAMLNEKRTKAVESYIEGLKKQIKIKMNKDVIS